MLAVKSMDVRENFKALCDKVFKGETLIVSRPKNENIVMMSEAGGFITKSIDELEIYES